MSWRSFLTGVVTAAAVLLAGAAIAALVFDLRIEKKDESRGSASNPPGASKSAEESDSSTLTKTEEDELFKADEEMLIYCSEDRSLKRRFAYSRGIEYLVGLAREKPAAIYVSAGQFSAAPAPTMAQYLVDEIDVIRRKCGEPRGLGDDQIWEVDVEHLQEVAQQIAAEGGP